MPEYEFIWTNGVLIETVELPPPPVIDVNDIDEPLAMTDDETPE